VKLLRRKNPGDRWNGPGAWPNWKGVRQNEYGTRKCNQLA
jgi:hypothetical protein